MEMAEELPHYMAKLWQEDWQLQDRYSWRRQSFASVRIPSQDSGLFALEGHIFQLKGEFETQKDVLDQYHAPPMALDNSLMFEFGRIILIFPRYRFLPVTSLCPNLPVSFQRQHFEKTMGTKCGTM
jgi:hypothetical protein